MKSRRVQEVGIGSRTKSFNFLHLWLKLIIDKKMGGERLNEKYSYKAPYGSTSCTLHEISTFIYIYIDLIKGEEPCCWFPKFSRSAASNHQHTAGKKCCSLLLASNGFYFQFIVQDQVKTIELCQSNVTKALSKFVENLAFFFFF